MSPNELQLISVISFTIVICMCFFTLGVIAGIKSKRDKLPEIKKPKEIIEDAATMLERRIEELKNAPTQMIKFNPYYKGIYGKGDI